ncbi:MAG: hypothetical protein ACJ74C_09625 [Gaiellaceae bacterium]
MHSETTQTKSTGLLVGGSVVAVIGAIVLAAGVTSIWADTQRDSNGYFSTKSHTYQSHTRAVETESIWVGRAVPTWLAGNVRLDVSSDKQAFVGIAPKATVDAYLARVAHAEATDLNLHPFEVTYVNHAGKANPGQPANQPFWEATSTGGAALTWKLRPGKWSVVVMNPDGSPNVSASIAVGVEVPALLWAGIGFAAFGSALLAGAALMFRVRAKPSARPEPQPATATA